MKFLLTMHMNPEVWAALSEETRESVMAGHGEFIAKIRASGEMISTQALGAPADSAVVRVRGGVPVVTDGPYLESKEFLAGFYLVECESRDRALEVAAMIPDAGVEGMGIEVRPVVFFAGAEPGTEPG
ncbi:YciI family protein [Amycolatopsis sp. PS_44_ISF1]|uniref:YciI family protein n=1 Tax=Amycolatopsis sp. PS_44_ISF1 TaxID=2974917 RepID=UPI0028DE5430|nr:YciI family protein [Amycolatopsis sp. PS_44_ISF1]MDT8914435.1 YciI family protein [Amycolatopsis sp. PS_44_ISF1]